MRGKNYIDISGGNGADDNDIKINRNAKNNRNRRFASLQMKKEYLDKNRCREAAESLVRVYGWERVSADQLAKEIYGHAFIYYKASFMKKNPILYKLAYIHCEDGIDVGNVVDRFQIIWEIIWRVDK